MRRTISVGDYVIGTRPGTLGVIRRITEKRRTGYSWVYLRGEGQEYWSENSSDPLFTGAWHVLDRSAAESPEIAPLLQVIGRLFDEWSTADIALSKATSTHP